MQKLRFGIGLFAGVLALGCGLAMAQVARAGAKAPTRQVDREFDPDAGGEVPYEPTDDEGEIAAGENCETVGGFGSTFQFADRFRGNLYRITENGVFLREVKMQLAFAGTANLFVSVHKKQADGSYVEVDLNSSSPTQGYLFVANAVGLGVNTAAYYSSGLIGNGAGVELPPGDYAIGFSWGPETIKFGRDTSTYPKPLEEGSTLASVSATLVPPNQPPLPANLTSLTEFTGGAYSMQICFVPTVGACCLSDGVEPRCENLLESQCVGQGSFFHGQRTTCKDTICEFGACCFDCDNSANGFAAKCGDNYVAETCTAAGGINFWAGVSCPGDDSVLCPKLVGACCNGTTCSLKCETECVAGGGTYGGDGTNCDPNTHKCKGACCVTGGCVDRTQSGCTGSNGIFHGAGTRCFSETCGGACCYGFTGLDFCSEFEERELCTYDPQGFPKMVYRGDGTTCPFDGDCGAETLYKACCLPDGGCMNTTQAVCTAPWIQGNFISTGTCATIAPNQCTNLLSRCCFNNGSCEVITGNACTARGGTPVVGQTTCSANVCSNSAGACCGTAAGDCTMKSATQCNADGGTYRGDDSDCSAPATTCPGYGACCRGNGECLDDQTQAQCTTLGGAFGGAGSTCATQHCDQRGACCAVTGTCLNTTAGTCAGIAGDFKGVGVQCAPGVCLSGACCLPVDGCKKRTQTACLADGGDYKGTEVACALDTCPALPTGACCNETICSVKTQASCNSGGGSYKGDDVACDEATCPAPPTGACCNGSICASKTQSACNLSGGSYKGDDVICDVDTCPAPPATGACCNGAVCSVTTEAGCAGAYKGDNVACDVNTCQALPQCTAITGTDPTNCAIDARRPYPPNTPGTPQGWNYIDLTFDCDTTGQTIADYAVSVAANGTPPAVPAISSVIPTGTTIRLNLNSPIPPGAWTCFTYTPANLKKCIGFLPADANGDRTSSPADILVLVDNLNGIRVPPLPLAQCDIDRSAICGAPDLLTEIDLLNGANNFGIWNAKNLPVCPSP